MPLRAIDDYTASRKAPETYPWVGEMIAAAREEHGRLEELARHMLTCIENGGWPCGKCPYGAGDRDCEKEFRREAEALGIEAAR